MESTLSEMQEQLRQVEEIAAQTTRAVLDSTAKMRLKLDELVEFTKSIEECAKHQKNLLDDVLTLSRLKAGMVKLRQERVGLDELVFSTERMFARGSK